MAIMGKIVAHHGHYRTYVTVLPERFKSWRNYGMMFEVGAGTKLVANIDTELFIVLNISKVRDKDLDGIYLVIGYYFNQ